MRMLAPFLLALAAGSAFLAAWDIPRPPEGHWRILGSQAPSAHKEAPVLAGEAQRPSSDRVGHAVPALPASAQERINQLTSLVDERRAQARYQEAASLAREILAIRIEHELPSECPDGLADWRSADPARKLVEFLEEIAALPESAQHELASADRERLSEAKYLAARSWEELEASLRQRLRMMRSTLGGDRFQTAEMLVLLGTCQVAQSKWDEAESSLGRALKILDARCVGRNPLSALASGTLAIVRRSGGDYHEAARLYRSAIEDTQHFFGRRDAAVAVYLEQLACVLHMGGDRKGGARRFLEALAIREDESGPISPAVAQLLIRWSKVLSDSGDPWTAEAHAQRALTILIECAGESDPQVVEARVRLAVYLRRQFRYDAARDHALAALASVRRISPTTSRTLCEILTLLSGVERLAGNLQLAEVYSREAVALSGNIRDRWPLSWIQARFVLSDVLSVQGDYPGADSLLLECLAFVEVESGSDSWQYRECLKRIGALRNYQKRYESAEELLRRVAAIEERVLAAESEALGITLGHLAAALLFQDRLEEAEAELSRSLEIAQKQLGRDNWRLARPLVTLGDIRRQRNDMAGAVQLYDEALQLWRATTEDRDGLANGLWHAASAMQHEGRWAESERLLGEALAVIESRRVEAIGGGRARAARSRSLHLTQVAAAYARTLFAMNRPSEALAALEHGRARALLDLMALQGLDLLDEAKRTKSREEVERLESKVQAEEAARAAFHESEVDLARTRASGDPRSEAFDEAIQERSKQVEERRLELENAVAAVQAELQELIPVGEPAAVEEIRAALAPGERLLCFSWSRHSVTAFLARSAAEEGAPVRGFVLADDKEAVEALAARATAVRASLCTPPAAKGDARGTGGLARKRAGGTPQAIADSHALFEALFPPALREEVLGAERLVVLPDGPLHSIPLEALVVRAGADWSEARCFLDEGPPITYAPSGSFFLDRVRAREVQLGQAMGEPSLLVLADPVFDGAPTESTLTAELPPIHTVRGMADRTAAVSALDQVRFYGGSLAPIPATRAEAHAIAATVEAASGRAELLLGADATLANLKARAPGQRFLHLATHGLIGHADDPYAASLALTQPDELSPDDIGFLRLEDLIRGWRGLLTDCELVVLSACGTQQGVQVGDSLLALPVGFFYAGAPSVVASLWQVDDKSTVQLMSRFYAAILDAAAEDKLAAFTRARRELRSAKPHPYFWAPFVYLGDPR